MQMKGNNLQDYSGFSTVITFAASEQSHLRLGICDVVARLITFLFTVNRNRKAFFYLMDYAGTLIFLKMVFLK